MTSVINQNGVAIDFDAAVRLMDDEIRERLHSEMAPCEEQRFFSAYEKAHEEKYGELWELSKEHPAW